MSSARPRRPSRPDAAADAEQLGQSRPSTTMDDYIGRKTRNPEAAKHLDAAMRSIHEQDRQAPEGPDI